MFHSTEGYFYPEFYLYSAEFRPWLPLQISLGRDIPRFILPNPIQESGISDLNTSTSSANLYPLSGQPTNQYRPAGESFKIGNAGPLLSESFAFNSRISTFQNFESHRHCSVYVHPNGSNDRTPRVYRGKKSRGNSTTSHQVYHPQTSTKICNFCRQNGDQRKFYSDHELKDANGNVVCPVLSSHKCEVCGATGRKAHTRSYCPILKSAGIKSKNATNLKRTLHDSAGRVRMTW